jgi:glucose/arabinose dehydrogenase
MTLALGRRAGLAGRRTVHDGGMPRAPRLAALLAAATLAVLAAAPPAGAASLGLALISRGLPRPVDVTTAPGDSSRIYVVLQGGLIRIIRNGRLERGAFLDLRSHVSHGNEQGLLSMAFDPRFEQTHRVFVSYTNTNGDSRVLAYHAISRDRLSPTNHNTFLEVHQPFANHNGGDIAFGPGGWLYVGLGDGGGEGDPLRTAQNPRSRLGKILRLNVSRRPAPTQIYALGVRNPWRFSFDRVNGDLWIGDVGQSRYEEIDRIARGTPAGVNLGWSAYEGFARYRREHVTNPSRLHWPVRAYPHSPGGNCAVTGGYVYRGSIVALRGFYLYADFCSGRVWKQQPGGVPTQVAFSGKVKEISSFGEGASGGLFLVSLAGPIYRIISVP